jgi:hypothetical protein
MKKYIVILLLVQFKLIYSQQVNLINEDFNSGLPANWTHCSTNWGSSPVWAVDSGALKEASGWYFVATSNWITLPAVDLTLVSNPFLEFDLAMAIIDTNIQLSVWWTTDTTCNTVWDTINNQWLLDSAWNLLSSYGSSTSGAANTISTDTSVNNNWTPLSTDYQTISLDLSQFANDSNIRFSLGSDYLNWMASGVWYVDNVRIFGNSSTGISKQSEPSSFQLFPNPTNGIIHFIPGNHIKNATLKITDITGEILIKKVIDPDIEEIDLSSYDSGIYFVHYIYDKRASIKKLIIQ